MKTSSLTFIDAVEDRESGNNLTEILSGFNMYFLSYNGSRELTRLQVPLSLRKTGLWITYVLYDKTVVTEWYAGEAIDDTSWTNGANWREGLTSDIWKNYRGYTNERPILKSSDIGFMYYDTTVNNPFWWNGNKWISIKDQEIETINNDIKTIKENLNL